MARKNVLMIAVDDMIDVVRYRTVFGVEVQTPAIDRLMARGVTFENAFTPVPLCNPARVATMTGRSSFHTDVHSNEDVRIHEVVAVGRTLPGAASKAGWFTASGGKIFHDVDAKEQVRAYLQPVIDQFLKPAGYSGAGNRIPGPIGGAPVPEAKFKDANTAAWAVRVLEKAAKAEPFFMSVGFSKPHLSWDVPKKYYDLYDRDSIVVPEIEGLTFADLPEHFRNVLAIGPERHDAVVTRDLWKDQVQAYLAAVSFADAQIAKVLDAMSSNRLWKDTAVVLWSDHGYHLGDRELWRKFTLWEEAASVPLVFVDPDVGARGARVSTPASLLDIWPTLSGLAGLPKPRRGDGLDLSPLMADASAELPRDGVVTAVFGSVSLRTETWRYTLYNTGEEELFRVDAGQVHGVNLLPDAGLAEEAARLRETLEKEVRKLGGRLVDAGEREEGGAGDDVFIVIGDGTAAGGDGDDVYFVTDLAQVEETRGGGQDLALVGLAEAWTLPEHLEDATLVKTSRGALYGNDADNELLGSVRANELFGGGGRDRIAGNNGQDRLQGGSGRDLLLGERQDDLLRGGGGADRLFGGDDDDLLRGGARSDRLFGGPGSDSLIGGAGSDVLFGGRGRDAFLFNRVRDSLPGPERRDEIRDFERGEDLLDLSGIDAVLGGPEAEGFVWIGARPFSGQAGELRYKGRAGDVVLLADIDGDERADVAIGLVGVGGLGPDDVVF